MSELALRLIEENKKTRATFLDLGNCGLTEVPVEIGELVWLEGLSFSLFWWDGTDLIKTQNNDVSNNIKSLFTPVLIPKPQRHYSSGALSGSPISQLINLKRLFLNLVLNERFDLSDISPLAFLVNLQELYLTGTKVSDISPLVGLNKLKYLYISNTDVYDLSSLCSLTSLYEIYISETQVCDLSPLARFVNLKRLDAINTPILDLTSLSKLTNLHTLKIANSLVSDLKPLNKLINLKTLNISGTKISDLSPLSKLKELQNLDIARTKIIDLSPLLGLVSLQNLCIRQTPVSDLTPLPSLVGLKMVDFSNTLVTTLLPVLPLLEKKVYLIASGCPINNPPYEVITQGSDAIINYLIEKQSQGIAHLYEAKLLIIGEGGSGKTSLFRRLYQNDKPLPEEADSTKGIDIHRHEFKLSNGRVFRLNVWDFGGQEIYHATHQFFLTKRSLYVLLDDTRKDHKTVQDKEFKYWLEVVDQLSDHSPVLIFQNEKGGRSKTIDEAGIKGHFSNVKDVFRGNLEVINSVDKLREALEYYARNLPHIGEELPKLWVSIRTDIEALAEQKPYISQKEYFDLYTKYLEFDRVKALHLSRYFHDLGVFLHFQDDQLLTRTVILQNEWATEAVFKMLDDEIVKEAWGHFIAQDCQRVWQDSVYADMHPELLALMQKFELCYPLQDAKPETWLAPQLLPPSKPVKLAKWEQPGDLVLRYRYEFMPKGLISRLMVRLHRFVPQPELGWVTGVLFERDGNKVLVEIPPKGGEIAMRARGPERKELLSVIAADLDALNDSFHGLKKRVEKLVPCNCKQCQGLPQPRAFELKELLRRKDYEKFKVECPGSFEYVDVLELLDGISVKTLPRWAEEDTNKVPRNKAISRKSEQRRIKIFLASSSELRPDRDEFDLYFRTQNDKYLKRGIYLEIKRWENFLDAMSETRLQNEYNQAVRECDIFVSLFFTKTGKFTEEEFDVAHQQFIATKKPRIYTFFKNADVKMGNVGDEVLSLLNFKKKLGELGHFYTGYDNIEHLKRQFKDQLEKLLDDGL